MVPFFIISVVLALFTIFHWIRWRPYRPKCFYDKSVFLFGHRGAPLLYPENSLASFNSAFRCGSDGIELDVQMSQDGHLVVFHDNQLSRMAGVVGRVNKKTLLELKTIKIKSPDAKSGTMETIPLLNEVLQNLPNDKLINIEIKSNQIIPGSIIKKTIRLVKNFDLEDRTIITCFNPLILLESKIRAPEIITGLLWQQRDKKSIVIGPLFWAFFVHADALHVCKDSINKKTVQRLNSLGLMLGIWTVNTKEDFDLANKWEPTIIISDHPKLVRGWL